MSDKLKDLNVLYYGCPYDLSGYGCVSRNHLWELVKLKKENLKIRLKTKKFWTGVSLDLGEKKKVLQDLEKTIITNKDLIFIEHLTPENFYIDPRVRYHIAYTPFETDGAPIGWLLPLRGMDEIWVPSEHNKRSYINVGLSGLSIQVIPHGIDPDRFKPDVTPLQYNNKGKFNFGSIFDWTERKNPTALIRAYYNAFYSGEDVTLTLRTFWKFPLEKSREYIKKQIEEIKAGYKDRRSFPKILLWFDNMNDNILPNFYKSMNCFVLPTRGEGFGLPFLEAMAIGTPVIGSSWGGNTEFMRLDNSILVGGKIVPIEHHLFLQLQPQYSGQKWFEIDEGELSKAMRLVYDNYDEAKKKALKASEEIRTKRTWKKTAEMIYKRLMMIKSELQGVSTIKEGYEATMEVR